MQTAITQLIEQLRLSGNIHGVMEAEKFLPVEKNQMIDMYIEASLNKDTIDDSLEYAENFFNKTFYNK